MLKTRRTPSGRTLPSALLVLMLAGAPTLAVAQVDCAKSPTFMRKIPGGQEIVFHPNCEPPALTVKPGKKQATMAPVSAPATDPVPVAGAKSTKVVHATAASAGTDAGSAAKPKALNGHKNYGDRVRVQAYTRTRK